LFAAKGRDKYNAAMAKYPIFLEMTGRRAVVIGAGHVAARKAEALLEAGARVVIVAEKIEDKTIAVFIDPNVELIKSKYAKDYLTGAVLAVAATDDHALNNRIYKDCQQLEILCNVVDDPKLCDFFVPAVVKRGNLQIAIGTEGDCPAYAGHLRKKLAQTFTDKHGQFLAELEALRTRVIEQVPDPAQRKAKLGRLVDDKSFEYFVENGPEKWRTYAAEIISGKIDS
jgi:precorrin-2 dehydrogenase/sirohydrochlorin ferrochelatase